MYFHHYLNHHHLYHGHILQDYAPQLLQNHTSNSKGLFSQLKAHTGNINEIIVSRFQHIYMIAIFQLPFPSDISAIDHNL